MNFEEMSIRHQSELLLLLRSMSVADSSRALSTASFEAFSKSAFFISNFLKVKFVHHDVDIMLLILCKNDLLAQFFDHSVHTHFS